MSFFWRPFDERLPFGSHVKIFFNFYCQVENSLPETHIVSINSYLKFQCIITGFEFNIGIAIFKVKLGYFAKKAYMYFECCFHGNGTSVELHTPSNIDLQHLWFPMIHNMCKCKGGGGCKLEKRPLLRFCSSTISATF